MSQQNQSDVAKEVYLKISLSDVCELHDALLEMTDHWHPNDRGFDYRCELCGALGDHNDHINHEDDCRGVKLLKALDEKSSVYCKCES